MIIDQIRALVLPFNEWSATITNGDLNFVEMARPGAIDVTGEAWLDLAHWPHSAVVGTAANSLRVWADQHGVWCEADLPATLLAADVRHIVARGDWRVSAGLNAIRHAPAGSQNGLAAYILTAARLEHVSLVGEPAYAGTCAWLASMQANLPRYQSGIAAQWAQSQRRSRLSTMASKPSGATRRKRPPPFPDVLIARARAVSRPGE